MALFWTFGISLLAIFVIFANKVYEMNKKRETILTRFLSRYDKALEKIILRLYFAFKNFEEISKSYIYKTLPKLINKFERWLIDLVSDTSHRFVHFWRGKKEILPRAKVSKFIASVLEYRYHSERERKRLLSDSSDSEDDEE